MIPKISSDQRRWDSGELEEERRWEGVFDRIKRTDEVAATGLSTVQGSVNELNTNLTVIQGSVSGLSGVVSGIQGSLTGYATKIELNTVNARVDDLQAALDQLILQVNYVKDLAQSLDARVSALENP